MTSPPTRTPSLSSLQMLRDEPLFGDAFDSDKDVFNHEAYAKAILDVIEKNDPPFTIGLFGPWGIGKSTIVNILFRLARRSAKKALRPIYFNAWKYSGDTFRRQFLIEIAKQVYDATIER